MALFEKYPKEIRKIIATILTGVIAVLLIAVMLSIYLSKTKNKNESQEVRSKILNFYNAILKKDVLSRD